jgi:mannitol-specific phosphotransferase system IIBC component
LASAAPAVAATAPGAAAAAVTFAALGAPAQVEAGHFASALIGIVILDSCRAPEEPVAEVANRATEVAAKHAMQQSRRRQMVSQEASFAQRRCAVACYPHRVFRLHGMRTTMGCKQQRCIQIRTY